MTRQELSLRARIRQNAARPESATWRRASERPATGKFPSTLRTVGTRIHLERNQTLFHEDDSARCVYEVVSGAVRMCKYLADGRRQIMAFALQGDFIGLGQAMTHTLSAEAASDTVVVAYPKRQFDRTHEQHAELWRWLVTVLDRQLSGMQSHVVMLGRQTGMERVASFTLMLFERSHVSEGDPIDVPMTWKDIADYLGLRGESVSRFVKDMKRRRVIRMAAPHSLAVADVKLLRDCAGEETGRNWANRESEHAKLAHLDLSQWR